MNELHDRKWTGKACLATLVVSLMFAFTVSRAEAPPAPEMWDNVGIWLHESSGALLEFREDGTYEMTLPNPFTGNVLLKEKGTY